MRFRKSHCRPLVPCLEILDPWHRYLILAPFHTGEKPEPAFNPCQKKFTPIAHEFASESGNPFHQSAQDDVHSLHKMDAEQTTSTAHYNGAVKVRQPKTELLSKEEKQKRRRAKAAQRDYGRGKGVDVRNVRDKKLRTNMKKLEAKHQTAIVKAKDAEILLENTPGFLEPETDLERTYKVRQDEITSDVAVSTAQKRFELKLDQLGPYLCDYTRNGRELLLAGRKGHVATFDWREGKLGCELQLGETVRGKRHTV